jgi:bifunctional non-homologous end joining protein LigD
VLACIVFFNWSEIMPKTEDKDPIFVIHKHDAKHLHYDFRLEDCGVLKSWALPKGPPIKDSDKRLAIPTEDHPLSYAHFQGVIPHGNYGAGTVMVWDTGTFKNITKDKTGKILPICQCLKNGRLKFILDGKRLRGKYALIKTKSANKSFWLFLKMRDAPVSQKSIKNRDKQEKITDSSFKINNHTIILSHENKIMFPDNSPKHDHITKHDIIEYYRKVAKWMVPHMKNRPVSMLRLPEGLKGESFYQKDIPESFPAWIKRISIPKEGGYNRMAVCNNAATLVYLANQCCITPHLWLSCSDKLNYPNRMIFDLDPSRDNDFAQICNAALNLKKILESIGLVPFVMTTGSRGLHVVVSLTRNNNCDFDTVREFAREIAEQLVVTEFVESGQQHLTTQVRKNKRHGRIYIDVGRNAYAQTSVAPYAVRAKPLAPVATPLHWKELVDKKLTAQKYNIKNIFKRLDQNGDPWKDINSSARSLKSARNKFERIYGKGGG